MNTILGQIQQQMVCPDCGGEGTRMSKLCGKCPGGTGINKESKQLTIEIPAGIDDGNRLRVRGEGDAGPKGGPPGDLYVFISVKRDNRFQRKGMDIFSQIKVSYVDAILGTTVIIPTVDGKADLNIPAGIQPGTELRINGKGMPKLGDKNNRGSQYVTVAVEIPQRISSEEKDLVKKLKGLQG
jgi:molecular chaperone DnaJ